MPTGVLLGGEHRGPARVSSPRSHLENRLGSGQGSHFTVSRGSWLTAWD